MFVQSRFLEKKVLICILVHTNNTKLRFLVKYKKEGWVSEKRYHTCQTLKLCAPMKWWKLQCANLFISDSLKFFTVPKCNVSGENIHKIIAQPLTKKCDDTVYQTGPGACRLKNLNCVLDTHKAFCKLKL